MTLPFSIWPRLGLRNYKNLKIQGTTKVTRKTSYKEDCILDLVLSPPCYLLQSRQEYTLEKS